MKSDWGSSGDQVVRVDKGMSASTGRCNFWPISPAPLWIAQQYWKPRHWGRLGRWISCGYLSKSEEFAKTWQRDAQFNPNMADDKRSERYAAWKRAVSRHCLLTDQYDVVSPVFPMWHRWQGWQKRQTRCQPNPPSVVRIPTFQPQARF